PMLWLASLAVLVATMIAPRLSAAWPARWAAESWPESRRLRWMLFAALAVLFVLAAAVRLVGLDSVPHGINADEGDRAATAISILHSPDTLNIFSSGWYYI